MNQSKQKEGQEEQTQKLLQKLQILFAGYQPQERDNETSIDYFTNNILYNSYEYVQELKQLTEKYQELSESQKTQYLDDILLKINMLSADLPGVNMSKLEVMALQEQMKIIFPYKSEIDEARKKAFKNLDDFTDISNGIRKYHLAKAQQFLPNIFSNKFSQQKIKNLLKDDFEETNQNYKKIEAQVSKKINAIEKINTYYQNVVHDLGEELDKL